MEFDIDWDEIDESTASKLKTAQYHGCLRKARSEHVCSCECGFSGHADIVIDHKNWSESQSNDVYYLCPNCYLLSS